MKELSKEELENLSTEELKEHLLAMINELPPEAMRQLYKEVTVLESMNEEEAAQYMEKRLKELESNTINKSF